MKMTNHQIESLARRVLLGLEKKSLIQFNKSKEAILARAKEILMEDFTRELQLDDEVYRMLDNIEKDQTDQFERHRMFKMLKTKLANERGIIL